MKVPDEKTVDEARENISTAESQNGRGVQRIFHVLAKAFNGLHWAVGITALPDNASPREERSFVLMWLGIIVFTVLVFWIMLRLL